MRYEDNVSYDDGVKNFDNYTTKYGDQMTPTMKRVMKWQTEGIYESKFATSEPIVFDLNMVNPIIKITNLSTDYFYMGKLTLKPVEKEKT